MCEMDETALDRHFVSQLRIMGEIYGSISNSDLKLSQRWMQIFHKADKQDKYARNCLMLLMHGQLKEMGKLGMPFTDMENEERKLEDVLNEYSGKVEDDVSEELVDENEDVDMDSNKSSYGGGSSRFTAATQVMEIDSNSNAMESPVDLKTQTSNDYQRDSAENLSQYEDFAIILGSSDIELLSISSVPSTSRNKPLSTSAENELNIRQSADDTKELDLEQLSQENEAIIKEINELYARSLEDEKHYCQTDTEWQEQMQSYDLEIPPPPGTNFLLPRLKSNVQDVIRRLIDWTPANGALDFLTNSLREILDDSSETKNKLAELDRQLEEALGNLLDQAGERREHNLRILYDQLFKQQQETIRSKEELLHQEKLSLALERQKLESRSKDLRQRESFLWNQQAAANQFYPPGNYQATEDSSTNQSTMSKPKTFDDPQSSCGCSECHVEYEKQAIPKNYKDVWTSREV